MTLFCPPGRSNHASHVPESDSAPMVRSASHRFRNVTCVLTKDFKRVNEDELTVAKGAVVTPLYQEGEWLCVRDDFGKQGFVPISFCEALPTTNMEQKHSKKPAPAVEPRSFKVTNSGTVSRNDKKILSVVNGKGSSTDSSLDSQGKKKPGSYNQKPSKERGGSFFRRRMSAMIHRGRSKSTEAISRNVDSSNSNNDYTTGNYAQHLARQSQFNRSLESLQMQQQREMRAAAESQFGNNPLQRASSVGFENVSQFLQELENEVTNERAVDVPAYLRRTPESGPKTSTPLQSRSEILENSQDPPIQPVTKVVVAERESVRISTGRGSGNFERAGSMEHHRLSGLTSGRFSAEGGKYENGIEAGNSEPPDSGRESLRKTSPTVVHAKPVIVGEEKTVQYRHQKVDNHASQSIDSGVQQQGRNSQNPLSAPDLSSRNAMYLAMYDFVAQFENDLSMNRGDLVRLESGDDPSWAWVRSERGDVGFVPKCFLIGPLMPKDFPELFSTPADLSPNRTQTRNADGNPYQTQNGHNRTSGHSVNGRTPHRGQRSNRGPSNPPQGQNYATTFSQTNPNGQPELRNGPNPNPGQQPPYIAPQGAPKPTHHSLTTDDLVEVTSRYEPQAPDDLPLTPGEILELRQLLPQDPKPKDYVWAYSRSLGRYGYAPAMVLRRISC